MAVWKKRWTYSLIRDMGMLKTKKDRRARLSREMEKIHKEIADLNAALNRAMSKGRKNAETETRQRIGDAKRYLSNVKYWHRNVSEGTK